MPSLARRAVAAARDRPSWVLALVCLADYVRAKDGRSIVDLYQNGHACRSRHSIHKVHVITVDHSTNVAKVRITETSSIELWGKGVATEPEVYVLINWLNSY